MKMSVAIHGVGMVGGALSRYFQDEGIDVRHVDPFKGMKDDHDVRIQFICVPTPFEKKGKGFDLSFIQAAFENIAKVRGQQQTVVVIKSTALPGTAAYFQKKYPAYVVLFNPEFLTERSADQDMRHPERQMIGYVTEEGAKEAPAILDLLPNAPYQKILKATEAELVKYFGNTFLALKVVFGNMMYDFCEKHGADYEAVKEAAIHDSRVGSSHLNVNQDGYRGYRGTCFPKDVRAFIQHGEELGVDMAVLKEAERRNCELTGDL